MSTRQSYHIWIRKPIAERFESEPNKGEIINDMLKRYYEWMDKKNKKEEPQYAKPETYA